MEGHTTAPLLNPLYRPPAHIVGSGRPPALRAVDVLRPCCELQGLEIWQSVYMRDNLVLHHRCVCREVGEEVWVDGSVFRLLKLVRRASLYPK